MDTETRPPSKKGNRVWWASGLGIGVLGGCLILIIALAVGGYYVLQSRQPVAPQPVVAYVLDTSARMQLPAQSGNGTRLAVAEAVLAEAIRPAESSLTSGLRVFGGSAESNNCKDTNIAVPFAPANQTQIINKLSVLSPGVNTQAALSQAMIAAIHDLAKYKGPHWLVVVTGGIDSCEAEANQLIAQAAKEAGIEMESYVIGYALSADDTQAIKSYVQEIPDGNFVAAPDEATLRTVLGAIQNLINNPSDLMRTAIAQAALPTATPKPLPTVTPPPPTETALPTATPYPAQTACDHPYWPLREGANWKYKDYTQTVVSVTGDTTEAQVVLQTVHPTYTNLWNFKCDASGFTIGDYTITFKKNNLAVPGVLVSDSGVWFPAADKLVEGYAWTDKRAYHHITPKTVANYFIAEDCKVDGVRPVTVGGQTYNESLQVQCNIEDTSTGQDVKSQVQQNYVYGIGQVNDLESYSVP